MNTFTFINIHGEVVFVKGNEHVYLYDKKLEEETKKRGNRTVASLNIFSLILC